jgi:hypothetical protein
MYASGSITSNAYYWTEGMEEWCPISELQLANDFCSPPPPPRLVQPTTEKSKGSGTGSIIKSITKCFAVAVLVLVLIGFLIALVDVGDSPKTPTSTDKARAIIAGADPVMASTHQGFLKIDRTLSQSVADPSDMILATVVVNKWLTAIPKQDLIAIYQAWCNEMRLTSSSKFPEFVDLCQRSEVKKMSDGVTKELLK